MYDTLISESGLAALLDASSGSSPVRVVDCRFDLADTGAGRRAYLAGHIPGALYADLDDDLSGPPATDHGRHPLPPVPVLRERLARLGIASGTQVIAYDASGGMLAARLWWMLRYLGHEACAVLDGGWQAWLAAGRDVREGEETAAPVALEETPGAARPDRLVCLDALPVGQGLLVDARAAARFRGEHEPLDPRAGHIPGARNHPQSGNLAGDGRFLPAAALREGFTRSLGMLPDSDTVHYCGSGVSACHNVLAQVLAGLPEPRLYVGSFSEWCADPARPVATGD